ncbi:MAG: carotenoid biosynthesis protein [Candidatus Binataceae bacterium]|nr:carotenoid biosynthesis protein [Candidatus Binataceae bacterium]
MHLLLLTIALRPYVFIFLAAFLFAGIVNYGLEATMVFTGLSYLVSFGCEWLSIHDGFPFGLYHYLATTRGRELWVAGVPFMDSISFTFLAFASYTVAMLVSTPLYRRGVDLRLLDNWRRRGTVRVWLLGALFMVMIDMVADPLSVRGNRWFLGRLFWYDPPGPYFGVPISNYLGWFFVAAVTIAIFQWLDRLLNRGGRKPWGALPGFPSRALLGPGLYVGVVCFTITMLFRIRSYEVGWASVFIFLPFTALTLSILTDRRSYGDAATIERHLNDFPFEKKLPVWPKLEAQGRPMTQERVNEPAKRQR